MVESAAIDEIAAVHVGLPAPTRPDKANPTRSSGFAPSGDPRFDPNGTVSYKM